MQIVGIILHHSICPCINGKGYDFLITKDSKVLLAPERTDPSFVHICLEGDFSKGLPLTAAQKEQLFVVQKLMEVLSSQIGFNAGHIYPHTLTCPGEKFPWEELVISSPGGYH